MNIEQILQTHKDILPIIKNGLSESVTETSIAHVGFVLAERLKIYNEYISGYEDASSELLKWEADAAIASHLAEKKSQATDKLPLSALLIQPVQRICRYPLLYAEILRHTPVSSDDYGSVKNALQELEKVIQWINAEKRRYFNAVRMSELEQNVENVPPELDLSGPSRFIVHDGQFKVSEHAATENVPVARVILFNDGIMWCKPQGKKHRYEGHLMFDIDTTTERIGLDVIRVQAKTYSWLLWGKDLLTMEHLSSMLTDTITQRKEVLVRVKEKRAEAMRNMWDRTQEKMEALEDELKNARRKIEQQGTRIDMLISIVQELCKGSGIPIPQELLAHPEAFEKMPSARRGSVIVSVGRPKVGLHNEQLPFVVVTDEDYVSDDPDELSFAFGELLLIVQDSGDHFRGRPLSGEVTVDKKIFDRHISLMVKKGSSYVRGAPVTPVKKTLKSALEVVGMRTPLLRSDPKLLKNARTSQLNDQPPPSPSLSAKRKGRSQTTAATPTTSSSNGGIVVELAPGVPDHSQEIILRQGWLYKKGGSRRNWKRRFFLLSQRETDQSTSLYYYETDKIAGKKPLGIVDLSTKFVVEKAKRFDEGFNIPFPDRLWEFRADSVDEATDWTNLLTDIGRKKSGRSTPSLFIPPSSAETRRLSLNSMDSPDSESTHSSVQDPSLTENNDVYDL